MRAVSTSIIVFCLILLMPTGSGAVVGTDGRPTRLLYGVWYGGVVVYDLQTKTKLGSLKGLPNIPASLIVGNNAVLVEDQVRIYRYRFSSLTPYSAVKFGTGDLVGEVNDLPIIAHGSRISLLSDSGRENQGIEIGESVRSSAFDRTHRRLALLTPTSIVIIDVSRPLMKKMQTVTFRAEEARFDLKGDLIAGNPERSTMRRFAISSMRDSDSAIAGTAVPSRQLQFRNQTFVVSPGCPALPTVNGRPIERRADHSTDYVGDAIIDKNLGLILSTLPCQGIADVRIKPGRIFIFGESGKVNESFPLDVAFESIGLAPAQ